MEAHLTVDQLASWACLPHAYQVRYAYDLSTGCDLCWSALAAAQPTEPRRLSDPFLRAIARVCHPKVDLSLPSQSIRSLIHPKLSQGSATHEFRPDDFPSLLLQESIACTGNQEPRSPVDQILSLPLALARILSDSSDPRSLGVDAQVNVHCVSVDLHYSNNESDQAKVALESALEIFTNSCDPTTEVNLALADLKVACSEIRNGTQKRTLAAAKLIGLTDKFSMIPDDPVRRFEIAFDAMRTVHNVEVADNPDDAAWVVSQLDFGAWGNEIHKLNALYHRAAYATAAASILPDLPRAAASSLESELRSIALYSDYYSLGRYYELLGRLRNDPHSLDEALKTYGALRLENDFLGVWRVLDKLDKQSRSKISDRAFHAFGQEVAHRMAREVDSGPEQVMRREILV